MCSWIPSIAVTEHASLTNHSTLILVIYFRWSVLLLSRDLHNLHCDLQHTPEQKAHCTYLTCVYRHIYHIYALYMGVGRLSLYPGYSNCINTISLKCDQVRLVSAALLRMNGQLVRERSTSRWCCTGIYTWWRARHRVRVRESQLCLPKFYVKMFSLCIIGLGFQPSTFIWLLSE